MKLITAIIKPYKLDDVRAALDRLGVRDDPVHAGQRIRATKGHHRDLPGGAEYEVNFVPKTRVEVVVVDRMADDVAAAIRAAAVTGKIGDGKIFVSSIEAAYRVRAGESGEDVDGGHRQTRAAGERSDIEPRLRRRRSRADGWALQRLDGGMRKNRFVDFAERWRDSAIGVDDSAGAAMARLHTRAAHDFDDDGMDKGRDP